MISIELDNIKDFMSHLFIKDTFDHFLCRELQIDTFVSFKIDGKMLKDFLNDIEKEGLAESPYANKDDFVFSMPPHSIAAFLNKNDISINPDTVNGLYLNIRYENRQLCVITGTSLSSFTLDKSVENAWDTAVGQFIKKTQGL